MRRNGGVTSPNGRGEASAQLFDATCAAHLRYHLMAMSNDDIFTPRRTRSDRPSQGRAPGRGPVIDQDGHEIPDASLRGPDASLRGQFESFRFDCGHSGANPFGNLTREQRLARLDALAKLLDVAFILPGTNIRYGIDGLIGLIPVVGDLITTAISLWLVREARALGAPWHITTRMLANVALDGVVGIIPIAGDAFDVMFRANVRNVRMLKRWMDKQPRI
jgi:uncharacterized protein DUF4112